MLVKPKGKLPAEIGASEFLSARAAQQQVSTVVRSASAPRAVA